MAVARQLGRAGGATGVEVGSNVPRYDPALAQQPVIRLGGAGVATAGGGEADRIFLGWNRGLGLHSSGVLHRRRSLAGESESTRHRELR